MFEKPNRLPFSFTFTIYVDVPVPLCGWCSGAETGKPTLVPPVESQVAPGRMAGIDALWTMAASGAPPTLTEVRHTLAVLGGATHNFVCSTMVVTCRAMRVRMPPSR